MNPGIGVSSVTSTPLSSVDQPEAASRGFKSESDHQRGPDRAAMHKGQPNLLCREHAGNR